MALVGVMRVRHGAVRIGFCWHKLGCPGWAFALHPFKAKQIVEVVVVPLNRVCGPSAFEAAGDGVYALARTKAIGPAKALLFKGRAFRFWTNILAGVRSAMGFAERVAASDQGNSFFVIHRHATKGVANVKGRRQGVWHAIGAFWVDID